MACLGNRYGWECEVKIYLLGDSIQVDFAIIVKFRQSYAIDHQKPD
jgi:hypothetical protein